MKVVLSQIIRKASQRKRKLILIEVGLRLSYGLYCVQKRYIEVLTLGTCDWIWSWI